MVFLFDTLPFFDAGVIVILFTIIVKLLLFPLSKKASKTQLVIKEIQPEIVRIKKEFKDDPPEQARRTFALYKENDINPFSSILLMFIQIPIVLGLYFIFFKGGLPAINSELLYSFIPVPDSVNMNFLGLIDISGRSALLAIFAGITSYIQIKISLPVLKARDGSEPNFKDELARSMNMQMRYVFPFIVFFIAYTISGAIALYWFTSNVFGIAQDKYLKRKYSLGLDTKAI